MEEGNSRQGKVISSDLKLRIFEKLRRKLSISQISDDLSISRKLIYKYILQMVRREVDMKKSVEQIVLDTNIDKKLVLKYTTYIDLETKVLDMNRQSISENDIASKLNITVENVQNILMKIPSRPITFDDDEKITRRKSSTRFVISDNDRESLLKIVRIKPKLSLDNVRDILSISKNIDYQYNDDRYFFSDKFRDQYGGDSDKKPSRTSIWEQIHKKGKFQKTRTKFIDPRSLQFANTSETLTYNTLKSISPDIVPSKMIFFDEASLFLNEDSSVTWQNHRDKSFTYVQRLKGRTNTLKIGAFVYAGSGGGKDSRLKEPFIQIKLYCPQKMEYTMTDSYFNYDDFFDKRPPDNEDILSAFDDDELKQNPDIKIEELREKLARVLESKNRKSVERMVSDDKIFDQKDIDFILKKFAVDYAKKTDDEKRDLFIKFITKTGDIPYYYNESGVVKSYQFETRDFVDQLELLCSWLNSRGTVNEKEFLHNIKDNNNVVLDDTMDANIVFDNAGYHMRIASDNIENVSQIHHIVKILGFKNAIFIPAYTSYNNPVEAYFAHLKYKIQKNAPYNSFDELHTEIENITRFFNKNSIRIRNMVEGKTIFQFDIDGFKGTDYKKQILNDFKNFDVKKNDIVNLNLKKRKKVVEFQLLNSNQEIIDRIKSNNVTKYYTVYAADGTIYTEKSYNPSSIIPREEYDLIDEVIEYQICKSKQYYERFRKTLKKIQSTDGYNQLAASGDLEQFKRDNDVDCISIRDNYRTKNCTYTRNQYALISTKPAGRMLWIPYSNIDDKTKKIKYIKDKNERNKVEFYDSNDLSAVNSMLDAYNEKFGESKYELKNVKFRGTTNDKRTGKIKKVEDKISTKQSPDDEGFGVDRVLDLDLFTDTAYVSWESTNDKVWENSWVYISESDGLRYNKMDKIDLPSNIAATKYKLKYKEINGKDVLMSGKKFLLLVERNGKHEDIYYGMLNMKSQKLVDKHMTEMYRELRGQNGNMSLIRNQNDVFKNKIQRGNRLRVDIKIGTQKSYKALETIDNIFNYLITPTLMKQIKQNISKLNPKALHQYKNSQYIYYKDSKFTGWIPMRFPTKSFKLDAKIKSIRQSRIQLLFAPNLVGHLPESECLKYIKNFEKQMFEKQNEYCKNYFIKTCHSLPDINNNDKLVTEYTISKLRGDDSLFLGKLYTPVFMQQIFKPIYSEIKQSFTRYAGYGVRLLPHKRIRNMKDLTIASVEIFDVDDIISDKIDTRTGEILYETKFKGYPETSMLRESDFIVKDKLNAYKKQMKTKQNK